MRIFDDDGSLRVIRRISVALYEPTRDGDTEIHLLTNLPKKVGALQIAELYANRWQMETAFQEMAENLEGEINTLGYPKAALFDFCVALVSYNMLSVVRAASARLMTGKRHRIWRLILLLEIRQLFGALSPACFDPRITTKERVY